MSRTMGRTHLANTRVADAECLSPDIADIPDGFAHHLRRSPLTTPWEPIYYKRSSDAVILAVRLAEAHTNSRGLAHGGFITALADFFLRSN